MRLALLSNEGEVIVSWLIEEEFGNLSHRLPRAEMAETVSEAYKARMMHRIWTAEEWEEGTPICHICKEPAVGTFGEHGPAVCERHAMREGS